VNILGDKRPGENAAWSTAAAATIIKRLCGGAADLTPERRVMSIVGILLRVAPTPPLGRRRRVDVIVVARPAALCVRVTRRVFFSTQPWEAAATTGFLFFPMYKRKTLFC